MARGWLYPWAIGSVAFGGASLLVPLYIIELGGDAFDLGLLAAVAAFIGVPGAIAIGRLADRHGRRRPYVLSTLLVVALTLGVIPLIGSIPMLIAANGAVWFAFAAAMPVMTLLAVDGTPAHAWSGEIARLNKYQGVGWAVGLGLGTVWTAGAAAIVDPIDAIRTCFIGLAALSLSGLLLGVRTFPADPAEVEPISGPRLRSALRTTDRFNVRAVTYPLTVARVDFGSLDPRRFISRFTPSLALYFVAILAMFTGFAAFFAPLPAFLTEVGLNTDQIFAMYLVSSVAAAVCFSAVGRLAAAVDVTILQASGLVLRGLAIPVVALVGIGLGSGPVGIGAFALVFTVIGVSWAVITVTAGTIVTTLTPVAVRGEALGLYAALTALAGGIGALVGGYIGAADFIVAFLVAGGLVVAGAAIVFSLRRSTPASHGGRTELPNDR